MILVAAEVVPSPQAIWAVYAAAGSTVPESVNVATRTSPAPGTRGIPSKPLTGTPDLASASITKPPVLLIHGSADPIVPVGALHRAEADLRELGVAVRSHISPGLGHSVDNTGLRLGAEFLVDAVEDHELAWYAAQEISALVAVDG